MFFMLKGAFMKNEFTQDTSRDFSTVNKEIFGFDKEKLTKWFLDGCYVVATTTEKPSRCPYKPLRCSRCSIVPNNMMVIDNEVLLLALTFLFPLSAPWHSKCSGSGGLLHFYLYSFIYFLLIGTSIGLHDYSIIIWT